MGGEKEDVKLLGTWTSPFVMRVRFALNLKKVPYEFVQVNPYDKPEILVKANPIYGKIPVLVHGDCNICESMIVVEYVDGYWKDNGPRIMPSDPYSLATARFWATFVDDKLTSALMGIGDADTYEEMAAAAEKMFGVMELMEGAFEECSKGKDFFGGEKIGFLDISFGSFVPWLKVAGKVKNLEFFDNEKVPLLARWAERFCAEEAAREVVPDTNELVDLYQNFFLKRKMLKGDNKSIAR